MSDLVSTLRDRIATLEEENRQLRELLMPENLKVPQFWKLSPHGRKLLTVLIAHEFVSKRLAHYVLYGDTDDPPENAYQCIHNLVSIIRDRMGVKIIARRGDGFCMSATDRQKLKTTLESGLLC